MSAVKNKEFDLCCSDYATIRPMKYDIAILPWGATEPHNYHLPYLTDSILSHDISVDAAVLAYNRYGVRCIVLPPVNLGSQNLGQTTLPFCIHARYRTQFAILEDIMLSLSGQGIKRLLIINGHGGNSFKNMIRDLSCSFPDFIVAVSDWYRMGPDDVFENSGEHADEKETSVMMHYHPQLVDMSQAGKGETGGFRSEFLSDGKVWVPRNWSKVSKDTGLGDPSLSTPQKGEIYAQAVSEAYADFLRDFAEENLYKEI